MYDQGTFDIDNQFGPLEGVHNPTHRWNGWAVPMFTMDSVLRIQKVCKEDLFSVYDEGTTITVDEDGVWELDHMYRDDTSDPRGYKVPEIVVRGVTYYGVGDGWCWSEVESAHA